MNPVSEFTFFFPHALRCHFNGVQAFLYKYTLRHFIQNPTTVQIHICTEDPILSFINSDLHVIQIPTTSEIWTEIENCLNFGITHTNLNFEYDPVPIAPPVPDVPQVPVDLQPPTTAQEVEQTPNVTQMEEDSPEPPSVISSTDLDLLIEDDDLSSDIFPEPNNNSLFED